jgi:hypothetical protein
MYIGGDEPNLRSTPKQYHYQKRHPLFPGTTVAASSLLPVIEQLYSERGVSYLQHGFLLLQGKQMF